VGFAPLICFVGSIKLSKCKTSKSCAIMPTFKAFTLQPSFVCKVCDDLGVIGNGASSYMGAHRFADHLYTVHVLSLPLYWRVWIQPLCPGAIITIE
jgi:hypothetical protein